MSAKKWPEKIGRYDSNLKRQLNKRFVVTTDGHRTEKGYFEWLKRQTNDVILPKFVKGGMIKAIVRASELKKRGSYDYAFTVCDIDEHTQGELKRAQKVAEKLGVVLCLSHESFEIWLLAHLDKKVLSSAANRAVAQSMVKKEGLVKGNDGKYINESKFATNMVKRALIEAERLKKTYGCNILESSPVTDVDLIVGQINLK
ncbi:RloB domain-containing protein [Candidatus Saccharibacteria bacterium]|nr:RloB domain-containing protein [Candidatus Saccharibacteria bacterium]